MPRSAGSIRDEPAGYRLEVDAGAVDVTRFEALRARASASPAREALGLLDAAHALWRGPAYLEFVDRDFARPEAVRLDELRLAVTEDRAELRLELGDAEAAVAALEPLVDEHPLRERARSRLMTALYRAGRVGAALDRYQHYRRQLADELGLDPSPALQDLHARILNHELPGPAAPPGTTWRSRTQRATSGSRSRNGRCRWPVGRPRIPSAHGAPRRSPGSTPRPRTCGRRCRGRWGRGDRAGRTDRRLAAHDRPKTAAEYAPSAPAVTGVDAERYRSLDDVLRDRIGSRAHERIAVLAAVLPRAQVVDRARSAITDLEIPSV